MDIYVAPSGEDLGRPRNEISKIIAGLHLPSNIRVDVRGLVVTMDSSFKSFGFGLLLAILLVYLILVAQFASFVDPFLIMLAVPTGLIGRDDHACLHRHHSKHSIADGHRHAAGHGGFQQHSDRGFRQRAALGRTHSARSGRARLPHPPAAHSDDLARNRRRACCPWR